MNKNRILQVLRMPHISEKSALAADTGNQYVFKVAPDANKLEIRKAVESVFDVKVETVRVLNVKGKVKRFGAREGRRGNWRKAYIRLQEGQEIEFAGVE